MADLLKEMEGHYAYDQGAVDSGVRDRPRLAVLATKWEALSADDQRHALGRFIAEAYLSDEGLRQGYGPEDACEFCRWLDTLRDVTP